MTALRIINIVTYILVIVGALNWGLIGAADFNLVTALFGTTSLTKLIYILVGASAIYSVANNRKI